MEFRKEKILVVDDEAPIREVLCASLADEGFIVDSAENAEQGLKKIESFQPQVVLLDIWMPGDKDGMDVLREVSSQPGRPDIIVMSGHGTIETAVEATKLGAWDFVEKPISIDKVVILLKNVLNMQKVRSEKRSLLNRLRQNIAIIGNSGSAKKIKELISKVAPTNSWVLIQGEQGVGKELVAMNIHYLSQRAGQSFVDFKCAHMTEDLIEGELFGYEKGSVIGSDEERKGSFDHANKGTLFLDDVDCLPMAVQARLLKYLEEHKIQRVGGSEQIELDVRVIAATTKNLQELVEKGQFREDLYYRLHVVPFSIPPVNERKEDIEPLVFHFSEKACLSSGYPEKKFSAKAIKELVKHDWPGNVREIKNFIERVYILTPEDTIDVHDLTFAGLNQQGGDAFTEIGSFREARSQFERDYIVKKINENNGNISKTAEAIGLERSYLHRKIKNFGIELE
ncbi:MAG: sigma-54-dependent Fis family transcriptional regulator [Bdellovibrionales bacterium]|nr:sigma-54 dependent transcriptional regulator [Bdellovibrionales bacterium]NQZ17919.1 sigma-54-dependent Fis family transcriptional regulator [Bdellovibrionales bacterium]